MQLRKADDRLTDNRQIDRQADTYRHDLYMQTDIDRQRHAIRLTD